jgi:N-acetylmuramic acid 6-phosphate etherase
MVDVQSTNKKLERRALEMVSELGKVSPEVAIDLLKKSENHVKTAIVMAQLGIDAIEARLLLEAEKGYLGRVLGTI